MWFATPSDRAGWIKFALTVFVPALVVFAALGMTADKTHGGVHVVFVVLTVAAWVTCVGVLTYGRKKYWKRGGWPDRRRLTK